MIFCASGLNGKNFYVLVWLWQWIAKESSLLLRRKEGIEKGANLPLFDCYVSTKTVKVYRSVSL